MGTAVQTEATQAALTAMKGFTSPLWPIRYKPLPDELLSSWLVRLAHGHGLKVQTFCNLIFGNRLQVWNRDVDRLAPQWLVDELSLRTGTPIATAYGTTLRVYEGLLYQRFSASGALSWIQTLKMYHRKREGFGLQYCCACLADGPQPYFRKAWRLAFNTICVKHQCMRHDRCPQCGASVAFHRMDMGRGGLFEFESLAACHVCQFNLCDALCEPVVSYDAQATAWLEQLCSPLMDTDESKVAAIGLDVLRVMHHLAGLLTSRYQTVTLREHLCAQLGIEDIPMTHGRVSIEARPLAERHHLVQLVAWLMVDLEPRLFRAWRSKAVRYNHLLKDFDEEPQFYAQIVAGFSDWRRG
ncbi:TniQ family protein [Polaromonas sp. UC242_47]|uniref:TniQ family protein n=1 Tax=Polaromonas sp. UC242_47 TaxID=3374626 RepID=UPI00378D8FA5